MKTRELTCIVCPRGCSLKVTMDDLKVTEVSGNFCKRGKEYAESECTNPQRTVTSTIRTADGQIIPVKTDRPIPKDKVFECMTIINKYRECRKCSCGDVIIENVFGSNIVATANS